jgi:hypothetical protein
MRRLCGRLPSGWRSKLKKPKPTVHSTIFNTASERVYPQTLKVGDHFTQRMGDRVLYGAVVLSSEENETRLVFYGSRPRLNP